MHLDYIFYVVFAFVAGNFLLRIIRNRGFRGALFGVPLRNQIAEMRLTPRGTIKTKLKIYTLEPRDPAGPHVGVEVIFSSVASWQMKPIALTSAEALQLADHLAAAVRESA